ncbi:MAG: response regulator with CheY-like receiver, AAA-type ATPase, and DNA-binding domain [Phycisphaerales bacterium]|nr:response regulator with CheY-like receiver, AAA-type ATPase, and DNA-binding domain [Phycisphaerales bacterium]
MPSAPSSSSSASTLPTGREVLVVDDEMRIRNMLSQALKEMGFRATLAPSAEAAARELAQRTFDILILDLNLLGMDGMEFLASVRKQHRDIQVIVLTGFGDLEAAKRAIHLDVVEFLTKPCALGSLEVALDRASKRRKGQIINDSPAPSTFSGEPEGPHSAPVTTETDSAKLSLEELEQRHILSVLERQKGNRAATATELGISLRKLYYRLGEYQKKGLIP